jgi:hypothetical protein
VICHSLYGDGEIFARTVKALYVSDASLHPLVGVAYVLIYLVHVAPSVVYVWHARRNQQKFYFNLVIICVFVKKIIKGILSKLIELVQFVKLK